MKIKKSSLTILAIGVVNLLYSLGSWIRSFASDEYGVYFNRDYVAWFVISILIIFYAYFQIKETKEK